MSFASSISLKEIINENYLNSLDLSAEKKACINIDQIEWSAGKEHYRLLAYITEMFNNIKILDIGTRYGESAICLSRNKSNKIITYDISNQCVNMTPELFKINNIEFRHKDFRDDSEVKDASIIFLDVDPHDGYKEKEMYEFIKANNFKGILIVDDIILNEGMKQFWASIEKRKEDITSLGHWSGTGVVYFD